MNKDYINEYADSPKKSFQSRTVNKYDLEINNSFMDCRIFWARVVSSENESLFTQYTKHTFYEIQYALEGHIGMTVGKDTNLDVAESDFVVIPPDTYHQVVDADSRGARFIMAFSLSPKDEKAQEIIRYLESASPCHQTPYMRELLSVILTKSYNNGKFGKRLLTSLLESFLLEIFEAFQEQKCPATNTASAEEENTKRLEAMLSYIKSFNGIGIGVAELAERFSISERHINRLFNIWLGKGPREVINHEKLKKIEEYVVSTKLSFNEIAELCGFSDEYAMNKFFKRYNLINLSDFRKIKVGKEHKE